MACPGNLGDLSAVQSSLVEFSFSFSLELHVRRLFPVRFMPLEIQGSVFDIVWVTFSML